MAEKLSIYKSKSSLATGNALSLVLFKKSKFLGCSTIVSFTKLKLEIALLTFNINSPKSFEVLLSNS